jgi:hypothetical protein
MGGGDTVAELDRLAVVGIELHPEADVDVAVDVHSHHPVAQSPARDAGAEIGSFGRIIRWQESLAARAASTDGWLDSAIRQTGRRPRM